MKILMYEIPKQEVQGRNNIGNCLSTILMKYLYLKKMFTTAIKVLFVGFFKLSQKTLKVFYIQCLTMNLSEKIIIKYINVFEKNQHNFN